MNDGTPDEPDATPAPRGVPRRAVLGGALGAAAAGIVGYEVGSAGASSTDDADRTAKTPPDDASAVAVVPKGEMIADDVQAALVDVYERTSALARLDDLRVAYELVDDFPPSAGGGRVGSLGWTTTTAGTGSKVETGAPVEGGVVRVATGPGPGSRAGLHLGLTEHTGAPVFTMQWRLRLEAAPDRAQGATLAFGALTSVTDDPAEAGAGPALLWVHDLAASPNWLCRVIQRGKVVEVDSKRSVNDVYHRFTITSDGDGLARFVLDDAEVGAIATDPEEVGRYGQGLVLSRSTEGVPVAVALDWFYLRRELPR